MSQKMPRQPWKRFTSYLADLSPANKCIAILMIASIAIQILTFLGIVKELDNKTFAIISFALLALLAVVLDSQVQQKRAFDASQRFHLQTKESLSTSKTSLDTLLLRRAPFDIRPEFIKPELDSLLDPQSVRLWKFRGGSGRWQRSTVLPTLAQVPTTDVKYKMLILDPRSETLCGQYAKYRNTHRRRSDADNIDGKTSASQDTARSVSNELLACIVAAAWFTAKSRVQARVFLSQTYSPLRMDLSATGAMLTVSDPNEPGLMCRADSWLYKALDDEFERNIEQSPAIFYGHDVGVIHQEPVLNANVVTQILQNCRVSAENESTHLLSTDFLSQLDTEHLASLALKQ
ncbi:hypothetical protein [Glutamicibacter arilaitensis]|uniref:hypothetical protein n=1 Tax=Glutamicibacter arilaitensis TaxID=256701 RepID=UPI003F9109C6